MDSFGNSMLVVQPTRLVRVFVLTPNSNRVAPVDRFLRSYFDASRFTIHLRFDGAVFVHFWFREDADMLHGHAWISDRKLVGFFFVKFNAFDIMPLFGGGYV